MTERQMDRGLLIAGQGAAAFSAALYAARYQINPIIVGEIFGGETATGGLIENYPGFPEIDGYELMMKFKEQAERYGVPIIDDKVVSVSLEEHRYTTTTASGNRYTTPTMILAVGRERRKLNLTHEDEWTGRGVSYCSTCDAPLHRGNEVIVVGGGNAATEGAILLASYADKVYLIYRGNEFTRPEPVILRRLSETPNIIPIMNTNVVALTGNDGLSGVELDRDYLGSRKLSVDGIFIEIGADPRVELANQLGVELNEGNEVIVDKNMKTNIHGFFAAGDVCDSSGDLKQTITAAAQGAIAATAAYADLTAHPQSFG